MNKKTLIKLLRKALMYRVSAKLDIYTKQFGCSDKEISERMGMSSNWLNDVKNNTEDITISSLARFFSVIYEGSPQEKFIIDSSIHKKVSKEDLLFYFFDQKILAIAGLINEIYDETTESSFVRIIRTDMTLYADLKSDWGGLTNKNKLSSEEVETMNKLKELIEGVEN